MRGRLRHQHAVTVGGLSDARVESENPVTDRAGQRRDTPDVGKHEGRDGGTLRGEGGEHRLDMAGHLVEVAARTQRVVDPGHHGGEVGPHRESRTELLGAHLTGLTAAHREVGIEQAGTVVGDLLGEPVRPAPKTTDIVAVPKPLGVTVTQGDIAQIPTARHGTDRLSSTLLMEVAHGHHWTIKHLLALLSITIATGTPSCKVPPLREEPRPPRAVRRPAGRRPPHGRENRAAVIRPVLALDQAADDDVGREGRQVAAGAARHAGEVAPEPVCDGCSGHPWTLQEIK